MIDEGRSWHSGEERMQQLTASQKVGCQSSPYEEHTTACLTTGQLQPEWLE